MAKSTRHQASAIPSQSFSLRSTFFHHTPLSAWMLMAVSYLGSSKGGASGMLAISSSPQIV
jgi:hypothetical protein